MEIIYSHGWILFKIGTVINAVVLKVRSKKHILEDPELERGYDKYVKGVIVYGNIPWVIMGIGNFLGLTDHIFEYFYPRGLNIAVLVFHGSIVILWVMSIYWVYFNDGANFIERHPGLIRKRGFGQSSNVTARQVKYFFPVIILGGVLGMVLMWFGGFPVPKM